MDEAIDGFALDDCIEILGDDLERVVRWSDGKDLGRLSGVPLRLRFVLKDADLYALQFRQTPFGIPKRRENAAALGRIAAAD